MNILSEIHSLEEYEQMNNSKFNDTSLHDYNNTLAINNTVYFENYSDSENKKNEGKLFFNGSGVFIKLNNKGIICKPKNKYEYYQVNKIDYNLLTIDIDDFSLTFTDLNDMEFFKKIIDSYNEKMNNFFDKAIKKTKEVVYSSNNDLNVKEALEELVDMIRQKILYTEPRGLLFLYLFSCKSDIVKKYIGLSANHEEKARQLISDDYNIYSSISIIIESISIIGSLIQPYLNLPKEYLILYIFLSLTEIIINKCSNEWINILKDKNKYDDKHKFTDIEAYIEYCINENLLKNDTLILLVACYLIKHINNTNNDILNMIINIKHNPLLKKHESKIVNINTATNLIQPKDNNKLKNFSFLQTKNMTPIQIKSETSEDLIAQLNSLIGLTEVKQDVTSLINLLKVRKIREERGFIVTPLSLHLIFSGNPGTGKTTVARLLAQIYKSLGLLSKGHLIEIDRSGLVGGYVGQTALKVQDVVQRALGGVLFIDEAYSLTNKGCNDYGTEAIDTLIKAMEDNRNDLVVIVAGYPELMNDFLNSNPGLRSRFNKFIHFSDYTPDEMTRIFKHIATQAGYQISPNCMNFAAEYFERQCLNNEDTYANARGVRNFFEKALVNQANRLTLSNTLSNEALITIELEDVSCIIG